LLFLRNEILEKYNFKKGITMKNLNINDDVELLIEVKNEQNIFEILRTFREPDSIQREYEDFLKKNKMKGKSITVRGINWDNIVEVYIECFTTLWDTVGLPESVDDYRELKEWYISSVLDLVQEKLFRTVYRMANFKIPTKAKHSYTPEDAINTLRSDIEEMLSPLFRMRELIKISLEKNPETINKLISESSELGKILKRTKKFNRVKENRADEIESFKIIIEKYNKNNGTVYSESYQKLCDIRGFEIHNYEYDDLKKFYNRFLEYKKAYT